MQIKNLVSFLCIALFSIALPLTVKAESPSSVKTLIGNGDTQFNNGKVQEAFNLFSQAFRVAPDNLEANYKLGQAAAAIKDFETAVMAFERVVIIDPTFVQAKIEMAKSFFHLGATETAKQYFREALEVELPKEVRRSITSFLAELN